MTPAGENPDGAIPAGEASDGAAMAGAASAGATPPARLLGRDEHAAAASMLARSFFDDPVSRWMCPDERPRMKMLERIYAFELEIGQREGSVWTVGDLEGVATWHRPGASSLSIGDSLRMLRPMLTPRLAARLPMVVYGFARSDRRHPRSPEHYYLSVIGTDPGSRGRGVGSALIKRTLDACDADRVPAYLESSKAENVPFYERHGFRVIGVERLPRGPELFYMWRDPRPGSS